MMTPSRPRHLRHAPRLRSVGGVRETVERRNSDANQVEGVLVVAQFLSDAAVPLTLLLRIQELTAIPGTGDRDQQIGPAARDYCFCAIVAKAFATASMAAAVA